MRIERQVVFWWAALLLVALAALALRDVLLPFVAGLVIAYALNPLVNRLVDLGLSRFIASLLIVAMLVVTLAVGLVYVVPILLTQVQQLVLSLPDMLDRLRQLIETTAKGHLGERFDDFKTGLDQAAKGISIDWAGLATRVAGSVWAQGLAIVNFLSLLLVTPLVVFYLLVDWQPLVARLDSWLPRDHAPTIRVLAADMDSAISAFIRGQGLVGLILALFYAVALSWSGVRYGLLIGLATGALSFLPMLGWLLGLVLASLTAILQSWPTLGTFYQVLAIMATGMALDSAVLSPHIVGRRIGLHPVGLIFALFVFGYLFGFVGVLVAVPMAAASMVLLRFGICSYLESDLYRGHGEGRAPEDRTTTGPDH